jgi:hypothetical protein
MTRTSKITLAVLGVIVVALIGGYLGAGLRGGSSAAAADSGGSGKAAFLEKSRVVVSCGWAWPSRHR